MDKEELIAVIRAVVDRAEADGCTGCAFCDRDEWEMPCAQCKRNCKDFWRKPEVQ